MISPSVIKVIVLSVLFVATFFFSMIPLKVTSIAKKEVNLVRKKRFQIVMSLLSCYAAGVFLATCLLDLFPDVQEKFADAFDKANILTSYPLAEFTMTIGLFLILFVEQIVLTCKGDDEEDGSSDPLLGEDDNYYRPRYESRAQTSVNNPPDVEPSDEDDNQGVTHYPGPESREYAVEYHYTGTNDDAKSIDYQDPNSHSTTRAFLLLTALSLHSVFEGLAVGLQGTSREVLQVFAALALHKSILAFSLGLNLGQSRLTLGAKIRGNLLFSITSPIGIAIGIGVDHLSTADSIGTLLTNGVLQGIACGTFLFIVFFEVLPHEFNSQRTYPNRLLKVLCLILGYATVALLLLINPSVVRPSCQRMSVPAT